MKDSEVKKKSWMENILPCIYIISYLSSYVKISTNQ